MIKERRKSEELRFLKPSWREPYQQRKRDFVIRLLKRELRHDVAKMKEVVSDTSKNYGDLGQLGLEGKERTDMLAQVKGQILAGEERIASQDLDQFAT